MAKIYGLFGSMTGKLADTVMAVRNGEQIARKYQPVVYNPSTPAQVAQRAKLKLMSQLSAVVAPVVAFRRRGSVSARNLFTKANFPKATFTNDEADITLTNIDLTGGIIAMAPIVATVAESTISVRTSQRMVGVDRVVYAMFIKQADGKLRLAGTAVAIDPSTNGNWPAELTLIAGDGVILAYGVRDNTEAARVVFGNLTAPIAETVAKIVTSSALLESDISLTETVGATIPTA